MSKRAGLGLMILMALLFVVMNRGAYKGYFSDDEIDNISWTPNVDLAGFAKAAASPQFLRDNFRPVGHFYFHVMERWFHLDFRRYVAAIHLFHLLNAWLLWILARKLDAPPLAASLATIFFAFHMALFDALWKPMYVFDVLCGTLSLASLIFWIGRRYVLSFAAFWLAYKSKELAVMLPAALVCYEWLLGEKKWKPLIPFLLASLSFGLQGILLNPNQDNDYTFRFTPAAFAKTSVFYAGRALLVPWLGFALLCVPFLTRSRRAWFGLAWAVASLLPLLFLPGRMFSAYCYVPLLGAAIALSTIDLEDRRARVTAAALLLLWIPWDYQQMRVQRHVKLAEDDGVRIWMAGLQKFAAQSPPIDAFVFAGAPAGFQRWGVEGAIKYLFPGTKPEIRWAEDADAGRFMTRDRLAVLHWDGGKLEIVSRTPETPDAAYLTMGGATPVWQLGDGWYSLEESFRWIRPRASARLYRPPGARWFELKVNIGREQLEAVGAQAVTVRLGGKALEPCRFPSQGWHTQRWELPAAGEGPVEVRFEVAPGFRPGNESRVLGVAIGGFGFVALAP